jgi:hypothetical protein
VVREEPEMSKTPREIRLSRLVNRIAGLTVFIMGVVIAYVFIFIPLAIAQKGTASSVILSDWGFISPAMVTLGAILLTFPKAGEITEWRKLKKENGSLTPLGILLGISILAPLIGVCVLVHIYIKHQLKALGYGDGSL